MLAIMGVTAIIFGAISAAAAITSTGFQIVGGIEAEKAADENKKLAEQQHEIAEAKQGHVEEIQKRNNKESVQQVESEIASSVAEGYLAAMAAKTEKTQKDDKISLLNLGSNVSLSSRPEGSPVEV